MKVIMNRCGRHCFECPCCMNSLVSLMSKDGKPFLFCHFCQYDSSSNQILFQIYSVDIVAFDKPTGMVAQLQKQLPTTIQTEFDALRLHYTERIKNESIPNSKNEIRDPFKSTLTQTVEKSIDSKTTLSQYLQQPNKDINKSDKMYPLRRALRVKHSKRFDHL